MEIDDGVPSETSQGVSHGRDVADVRNDGVSAARRTRTPTPVEDVHLVAAGDREFRAGAGEDAGASEEEDSHGGGKPTKGASSVPWIRGIPGVRSPLFSIEAPAHYDAFMRFRPLLRHAYVVSLDAVPTAPTRAPQGRRENVE